MADMRDFGEMDVRDRGGIHDFFYEDGRAHSASDGLTPSQTVGPFFAYGLTPRSYGYGFADIHSSDLVGSKKAGNAVWIEGQIFDGEGVSVHDAVVEVIQADENGIYADSPRNDGFTGFGRCGTGAQGPKGDTRYLFRTIKPGATQSGGAPFVTLVISMRGMLNHCVTRMYFPDDDHAEDGILAQVPEERRDTLLADQIGPNRFRFDIHMQGPRETVFFDL